MTSAAHCWIEFLNPRLFTLALLVFDADLLQEFKPNHDLEHICNFSKLPLHSKWLSISGPSTIQIDLNDFGGAIVLVELQLNPKIFVATSCSWDRPIVEILQDYLHRSIRTQAALALLAARAFLIEVASVQLEWVQVSYVNQAVVQVEVGPIYGPNG
ncbi:hypothetical protein C8R46DRAFT_1193438 [Mycena filopes]|nr:hypothetical protein C8R46DRAFT_1193438 [Mycena filopes]